LIFKSIEWSNNFYYFEILNEKRMNVIFFHEFLFLSDSLVSFCVACLRKELIRSTYNIKLFNVDAHSSLFMLPCKSNISYRLIQPLIRRLTARRDAHSFLSFFILSCKSNFAYRLIQSLARLVSDYYCY